MGRERFRSIWRRAARAAPSLNGLARPRALWMPPRAQRLLPRRPTPGLCRPRSRRCAAERTAVSTRPRAVRPLKRRAADTWPHQLRGRAARPGRVPALEARGLVRSRSSNPSCAALQCSWPEGDEDLRAWIAGQLRRRGAHVARDDVIVTSGAQQAVSLAAQLVRGSRARIGVDRESSPGAPAIGSRSSARRSSMAAATSFFFFFLMPIISCPPSPIRGDARCRAAIEGRVPSTLRPIIEDDDHARIYSLTAPSRGRSWPRRPDRVFHVGTFSNDALPRPPRRLARAPALAPRRGPPAEAIRRSAGGRACRRPSWKTTSAQRTSISGSCACGSSTHRRAARMERALRKHLPGWRFDPPAGGFAIWVEARRRADTRAFFLAAAIEHGVAFDLGCAVPGSRRREPVRPPALLLLGGVRRGPGRGRAPPRAVLGRGRVASPAGADSRKRQHRPSLPFNSLSPSLPLCSLLLLSDGRDTAAAACAHAADPAQGGAPHCASGPPGLCGTGGRRSSSSRRRGPDDRGRVRRRREPQELGPQEQAHHGHRDLLRRARVLHDRHAAPARAAATRGASRSPSDLCVRRAARRGRTTSSSVKRGLASRLRMTSWVRVPEARRRRPRGSAAGLARAARRA